MKKNIKKFLYDYYNSLTSNQKLIYCICIFLFVISIYYIFINNSYRENEINYKKVDLTTIINSSDICYDRNIIKSLDDILNDIIKVHDRSLIVNNKNISLKKFYNESVSDNYKKAISYKKFKEKINNLYDNYFMSYQDINYSYYIDLVYYSQGYDMYLIKVVSTKNINDMYIGFKLLDDSEYIISFIE